MLGGVGEQDLVLEQGGIPNDGNTGHLSDGIRMRNKAGKLGEGQDVEDFECLEFVPVL